MSESKHTPGPWRAFKQADSTAMIVTTAARDQFGRSQADIARLPLNYDAIGNAQLIAAAPELLDLCREALMEAEVLMSRGDTLRSQKFIDDLKAAIAKAEGH